MFRVIIVIFFLFFILSLSPFSIRRVFADTGTIGHGDQIVFTLNNDGSVIVNETILFISNVTVTGTYTENGSVDGTLIGEPELIPDATLENSSVYYKSVANLTSLIIVAEGTLPANKFEAVRLNYKINGLLQRQNDGSWLFEEVFTMSADSIAPPEIVVKVPVPSQFEELKFEEIIPTPSVNLIEGNYYVMSWTSSTITFQNVTQTLVRLRYSTSYNWGNWFWYWMPIIVGVIVALPPYMWAVYSHRALLMSKLRSFRARFQQHK